MTSTIGWWAHLFTIITCVTAIIALWIGICQFKETQESTRETQAVDLFLKFNQLNIDQKLSSTAESDHWFDNSKFAITESLYLIACKQNSWLKTIVWMLFMQKDFITSGGFEVDTYSAHFAAFCKKNGYELKL